jgi:nucleotide-binding universal stress UspA family protein
LQRKTPEAVRRRQEDNMPGIICAIRGGPDSQPTIEKALDLAEQTHLPLHFLYVVSLDFLGRTTTNRVQVARDEILKMCDFILLKAQERAAERGITDVTTVDREGEVSEEIISLCAEIGADYVVLGHPVEDVERNVFTRDLFQDFVEKIKAECKANVVLAEKDAS